ncbi:tRNA1(Val) (adenine(37)-N6)-methyltransferase [Enterococcus sp. BWB1-3]|uniref:tRNA1(Val) (adenine(37)-N6)-methyltransferase n=1 Tax=unclassified Enterococcus TaxID=2608891 RepID=UPI0019236DE1|nr:MULTISPECIES: tRNA1(Val) (adenine(37)-N6)-methyltransferase [unclassified Enterococcus]MBL1229758.1 tRNA1(Val) (adenine(37)-N6)-methyltransferase [Enterococcus sp. BWB1-3]MCB5956256.1 tRNA1(Val) (adenine(37)-N6)-methyltransferase [Enterococcus sp. CWB-B31]
MLLENERVDQLYAEDIQIIQSKEVFSFSMDAVLLANFPTLPKRGLIVDLCAGNGAVGLFASRKTSAVIKQIELQPRLADMGTRSIQLNQLENQMEMIQLDLKDAPSVIKPDSVDLILCNPPYFKELPDSRKNPNPYLAIARHEIHTSLNEVINVSAKLLKTNGRLAMVHRPDRFLDIMNGMQEANIAPKRVQFVYPKPEKEATILLVEGILRGKKDGFRVLPPFYIQNEHGSYQTEMAALLYGN